MRCVRGGGGMVTGKIESRTPGWPKCGVNPVVYFVSRGRDRGGRVSACHSGRTLYCQGRIPQRLLVAFESLLSVGFSLVPRLDYTASEDIRPVAPFSRRDRLDESS